MHLISSQNASLWIDQMCFSVSRYMLTSSTSCIDAILCMMLFHANMEWDDNEFISTQELKKKKGSRANRHLYLAICFKRQMPKIKLLQIEILVNLSVPSFTVSVGRMSLPLSGHYDAYSCAIVCQYWMFLLWHGVYSEGAIVLEQKTISSFPYFQLQLVWLLDLLDCVLKDHNSLFWWWYFVNQLHSVADVSIEMFGSVIDVTKDNVIVKW